MKKLLPILTLVALSSTLAEFTTGSTPFLNFFHLGTFFIFAIFAYGIPVVLFREFTIRFHLNYIGIFFLGIAFGLYSEGFIAKTLILQTGLPAPLYNNYGYLFGISLPFSLAISVWHSLASVVLPIFFTHYLFPQKENDPWMPRWTGLLLGVALTSAAIANFLSGKITPSGTIPALIILLLLMTLSVITGYIAGRRGGSTKELTNSAPLRPFFVGLGAIFYFCFNFLAAIHLPLLIFISIFILSIYFYYKKFCSSFFTQGDLLLFGLGFYTQQAFFAIFLLLTKGISTTVTAIIPLCVFVFITCLMARRLARNAS